MERYQVILTYDGTNFQGYQRQPDARTVQGVFEAALRALGWQDKSILAAGRTDTGVHASGQVVAFDLQWAHTILDLLRALNDNLPSDVAVREVMLASDDFHPRHAALARRYQYRLFCDPIRDPLREGYAWRIWPRVFQEPLEFALKYLIGSHDFAAFGAPHKPGGSTVREISAASWHMDGSDLLFEVVGNAFLYHMVRRLVFVLVKIGQGELHPEILLDLLNNPEQPRIHGLAPPQGLFLAEVIYPSGGR